MPSKYHRTEPLSQAARFWRSEPRHPLDTYHGDHDVARLQREYPLDAVIACTKPFSSEFAGVTPRFSVDKSYRVVSHNAGQARFNYPGQTRPISGSNLIDASVTLLDDLGRHHGMPRHWMRAHFAIPA